MPFALAPFLFVGFSLLAVPPLQGSGGEAAFVREKEGIILLTVERARQAPGDSQRALKAGEDRLRRLHDAYKAAKSTPPVSLERDVTEMTTSVHRVRLARSRGQFPSADPRAEGLIQAHWEDYRSRVEQLLADIPYKRGEGASESSVYWGVLKDHAVLAAELVEALAYNTPPGERSAEEAVAKERRRLLKALEDPVRVRGLASCVVTPEESARPVAFDIAPFYRAAGLLPTTNPLHKASFEVPPACRTVTLRESGAQLIFRAVKGRGLLRIGSQEKPLAYGYVVVPPEAPYIVDNPGQETLQIDFIAILP